MPAFHAPIGFDDFAALREAGRTYVDKTAWIGDIVRGALVTLFTRPRRFGKSLNLSTLRYFFEPSEDDRAPLFDDLAVWGDAETRAHFGQHPVLLLSFKEIKAHSYTLMLDTVQHQLRRWLQTHPELLGDPRLGNADRAVLTALTDGTATDTDLREGLLAITSALETHYGARAVLLIDEYDTPIQEAWLRGYYDDAISFFRPFLGAAFKGNPHLYRGVLTGILRVAKESIFSGLNNLAVYDTLRKQNAAVFGFSEAEVIALARSAGRLDQLDELRDWYNGYRFGDTLIYNPWSIISALDAPDDALYPYWLNTGANDLIRRLTADEAFGPLADLATLLHGETIERPIYEAISLREVDRLPLAVWSFLLASGYLTAEAVTWGKSRPLARLRIPNREVRTCFETLFIEHLETAMASRSSQLDVLRRALLGGDAETLEALLTDILLTDASHHDFPARLGEAVYQTFVLGMLVHLRDDYDVRSNRESGFGRADVLVCPRRPGDPGVVMELKVPGRDGDVERALTAAAAQIRDRRYTAELRARGADPIHALAIVFDGKLAHVRPVDGG